MKLFLGLIFILLDFEITVGTAVIGLVPDFIGYLLLMKALSERDDPWRHLAFGLMLTGAVLFIADLVDKTTLAQVWFQGAAFLAEIGMLALLFHIVRGKKRLRELFPVVACIRVLCCLISWIPLVGTVCSVANAVVAVCFLIAARGPLSKGKFRA